MKIKDYLGDILEMEKNMVVNYAIALNEASCDDLYKEYKRQFDVLSTSAKSLFNIAYNNGFYTLSEESASNIKNKCQTLEDDLNSLKCED
jgi:spore coat protein CotF